MFQSGMYFLGLRNHDIIIAWALVTFRKLLLAMLKCKISNFRHIMDQGLYHHLILIQLSRPAMLLTRTCGRHLR